MFDAAGRFEFPPEVEPFNLPVAHAQGYARVTEKQFAALPDISIQPWPTENRPFPVD